jgi:hypothetical protein
MNARSSEQSTQTSKIMGALSAALEIAPLPVLSPCYCGQCKLPLDQTCVIDDQHAWCQDCDACVETSWFQVPSWTVGVLVYLASRFCILP